MRAVGGRELCGGSTAWTLGVSAVDLGPRGRASRKELEAFASTGKVRGRDTRSVRVESHTMSIANIYWTWWREGELTRA